MATDDTGNLNIKRPNLIANMGFSLVSWALPLLLTFAATKILIEQLGNEAYGYYAIALGFLNFAFTAGVARVALKYIPEYRAAGDEDKVTASAAFAFWLGFITTAVQGLFLALIIPLLIENVLNIPDGWKPVMYTAMYLVCLAGMLMSVVHLFQSILQALHQFRLFAVLTCLHGLILSGGNIALALSGYGIRELIIWNLVSVSVNAAALYIFVRRTFPAFILKFTFDRDLAAKMTKFAGSIIAYQALTSFLFVFERSWVLRKFGAEAVTYYVIPLMLGMYLHAFLNSIVLATVPGLNELLPNKERLTAFYRTVNKLVSALAALILLSYVLIGREFLELWLGAEFAEHSYTLLILHGAAFGLIAVAMVSWHLAEAFHHPGINAFNTAAIVAIALALIVLLADGYGANGIACGRVAGAVLCLPLIFYIERICLGKAAGGLWAKSLLSITLAGILLAAFQYVFKMYVPNSWPAFLAAGIFGSLIFLGTLVLTGHLNLSEIKGLRSGERGPNA